MHFYSNRGWNGHDYMDFMQITFNGKRPIEYRSEMLVEILSMLEKMEYKNIGCRIQHEAVLDHDKISEVANKIYNEALDGKFLKYNDREGKIKVVGTERTSGHRQYGFFRKGARKNYNPISNAEIVLMGLR